MALEARHLSTQEIQLHSLYYLRCCSGSQSHHSIPLLGAAVTLKPSLAADPLTLSSCRSSCAAWITTYRSADRTLGSASVGALHGVISKFDVLLCFQRPVWVLVWRESWGFLSVCVREPHKSDSLYYFLQLRPTC